MPRGNELLDISKQFRGLPMEELIGGPLTAACNAQEMLAGTTVNFIERVCFKDNNAKDKGKDGYEPDYEIRTVPFSFVKFEDDGNAVRENKYEVKVPIMAIINIPSLQVTDVDIKFSMEVKSSFSETEKSAKEGKMDSEMKVGYGPFSLKVKMSGSVSSSKETQRKSDNSAKYDVNVVAKQLDPPEGLSRVLDMLSQCVTPIAKETKQLNTQAET